MVSLLSHRNCAEATLDVTNSSDRVTDRIEVRGLRVMGLCGVLAEETVRPQPLEIDVDIAIDLSTAGTSNSLEDTIDYSVVAAELETLVMSGHFALLEHLAERMAQVVLSHSRVDSVTIAVRKLRPPVPQHMTSTGVRIVRGR